MGASYVRRDKFPAKTTVTLLLGIVFIAYLCSEFRVPFRGYPKTLTNPYQPVATQPVRSVYYSTDVPGTLVCPDPSSLHDLLYDYERYRIRRRLEPHGDLMGRSQPPAMPPNPFPRPTDHDCAIVAPNTPMQLATDLNLPEVVAKMPNGVVIHGYTLPQMIQRDSTHQ